MWVSFFTTTVFFWYSLIQYIFCVVGWSSWKISYRRSVYWQTVFYWNFWTPFGQRYSFASDGRRRHDQSTHDYERSCHDHLVRYFCLTFSFYCVNFQHIFLLHLLAFEFIYSFARTVYFLTADYTVTKMVMCIKIFLFKFGFLKVNVINVNEMVFFDALMNYNNE